MMTILSVASWLARVYLRLAGWQIIGDFSNLRKAVVVGAPHTSSWDFVYSQLTALAFKYRLRWVGKESHFRGIKGVPARWLGGIAVNRTVQQNAVDHIATLFDKHDTFMMTISPEGTRKKTGYWRTGFYYIALQADVPIILARIDYQQKQVTLSQPIQPGGDIRADFEIIREYYKESVGRHSDQFGEIQLDLKDDDEGVA